MRNVAVTAPYKPHLQLQMGFSLDDNRIAALETLLKTRTDRRYERLLDARPR